MSLYRFTEQPSGFGVERLSHARLTVQLEPWALSLRHDGNAAERWSFYDGDRLTLRIAMKLLGEHDAAPSPRAVREAHTIKTDVGLQRLRLLAQVDPGVHEVQLLTIRIAGRVPALAQEAALYREPYILKDVLAYRAAAIAFAYLQSEQWHPVLPTGNISDLSAADLLSAMSNWRGLFSPDGKPYGSLNRTLMNLPRDVPPELVCQLSKIRLERPVVNWLELTTLMLYVSTADAAPPEAAPNRFRMFHHATAAEITDAIRRIGTDTNRELHPRQPEDLRFAIRYLCDYPEPYHGTLGGLVDRVIRWHRQAHERQRLERQVMQLGGYHQPTVPPLIPLPSLPGVRFLGTVGEIAEEGQRMGHCIATRAEDALHGRCYLFHIDHQGERASVEVSPQGKIVDAEGPHNTNNAAVWWGATQLRSWAAGLVAQDVQAARDRAARRRRMAANPNQLRLPF